jgi:hypothetical protein
MVNAMPKTIPNVDEIGYTDILFLNPKNEVWRMILRPSTWQFFGGPCAI